MAASSTQKVLLTFTLSDPDVVFDASDTVSGVIYLTDSKGRRVTPSQTIISPGGGPVSIGRYGEIESWDDVPVNLTYTNASGNVVAGYVTATQYANIGLQSIPIDHLFVEGLDGTYYTWEAELRSGTGAYTPKRASGRFQISATVDYETAGSTVTQSDASEPVLVEVLDELLFGTTKLYSLITVAAADAVGGALLAANNLSDVANPATSLTNLGGATATSVATNTTDIATESSRNDTQDTNITTNTTNIATNATDIATESSRNDTQDTAIALNTAKISARFSNLSASTAPTATDDSGSGYEVGSIWIDVVGDIAYVCLDASVAAAVWLPIGSADLIATNTTDIATESSRNDTQDTNITTNTTNIATNATDIATESSRNDTQDTAIALNTAKISARFSNLSASTAPTATDDSGSNYEIGSLWVDVVNDVAYVCLDASVGAAIWQAIGSGSGASWPTDQTDQTTTTYTFVADDAGKIITTTNIAGCTVTMDPSIATVDEVYTVRAGSTAGATIIPGAGVTFNPPGSFDLENGQVAVLVCRVDGATPEFDIFSPPPTATTAEMEAGTEVNVRMMSPYTVRRGIMSNTAHNHPGGWSPSGGEGAVFGVPAASSNVNSTVDRLYYAPFIAPFDMTLTQAQIKVMVGAAGTLYYGVVTLDESYQPLNIVDQSSVDITTTGFITDVVSIPLTGGVMYGVWFVSSSTAQLKHVIYTPWHGGMGIVHASNAWDFGPLYKDAITAGAQADPMTNWDTVGSKNIGSGGFETVVSWLYTA